MAPPVRDECARDCTAAEAHAKPDTSSRDACLNHEPVRDANNVTNTSNRQGLYEQQRRLWRARCE
eukprot:847868-Amphidinium_carterae.2